MTIEQKILAMMEILPYEYVNLKYLIEDHNRGEGYNLKRIIAYLDFWYSDLHYISVEGTRYYINDSQTVHAIIDTLIQCDMEKRYNGIIEVDR